ncbi:MAG: pyrroline-5-carboxylate reductase [Brotaphodocola sp.]
MRDYQHQYGFIGMGNMGYAILNGLLGRTASEKITFYERSKERMEDVSARTDVIPSCSVAACVKASAYIVMAVKPQQYDAVIEELREVIESDQIIISIAPGISITDLEKRIGKSCRIVRAMPNTPALVGMGMTGVSYDAGLFCDEEKQVIHSFFESFGRMEFVDEKLMDTVVCASGSSPAYVYMFIEALADSAVKYGMPRNMAYKMVAQTVMGSAKMVLETGEHPGKLKDQVCSPGGTTIAGVAALEEFGMRNSLMKATDACYAKCTNIK